MYSYSYSSISPLNFADVVESWEPSDVADWLRGLNDCVLPFIPHFLNRRIAGSELFTLDEGDLERIGVTNVGAQQAISSALYQLSDLRYSLDKKNLQTLALKLGVQARNLHNELKFRLDQLNRDANAALGWLPNDILSYVSTLVDDTKEIVSWLDRSPFDAMQDYVTVRNTILSFASTIVQSARQPSNGLTQTAREIQMACTQLCSIADKVVEEFSDPLILQTAYLEKATVRRSSPTEDFGINIESTTDGVHVVSEIKFQSPADFAGKIEAGDEIVQACGRTVLGWPLSKLAAILSETKTLEAPFLLKKRPRHFYGHQTLGAKPTGPAAPKLQTRTAAALPTLNSVRAVTQLHQLQKSKTRRRSSSISVPRTPVEKVMASELKFTPPRSPASPVPLIILPPNETSTYENEFETTPQVPQRRATVSGGSPTLKRLSLHLNRNISVNPRPQSHWFQDSVGFAKNLERVGDVCDLDMVQLQSKLSRPSLNFRASLVNSQLFESPKSQPIKKKPEATSPLPGLGSYPEKQFSLDDEVFDYSALEDLANVVQEAMPSDLSDGALEEQESLSSVDDEMLEEAEPDDLPPEAAIIDEEWTMPPMIDDGRISVSEKGSLASGGPPVHKTRSFPGRDLTAPRQVQNPLATLPRNSQAKLMKFFGETMWYDLSSDAEDSQSASSSRKSPLTSSHVSIASGSWSSKFSPRSVGQMIHLPKRRKETLPSESGDGSPILTGMRRLTSRRPQQRFSSAVDPGVIEKMFCDGPRKSSVPAKSSLVDKQILAILNNGNLSDTLRLKLHCYLPCKSIGAADYSGWVHRARCQFENAATKKWNKRWLVLKKECLLIYKSAEDMKAEGVLWLPSYRVCPAGPEYKTTKKNVFKLYSTNSCFYFYCYHRQDMINWLQRLGLAAIGYNESNSKNAHADSSATAEFYFAFLDDGPHGEIKPHGQSPTGTVSHEDSLFNTLRQSWRRSQLSRENSNESSLSCHSEGAISTSSATGLSKIMQVRDPLRVRGSKPFNETRSISAGRLENDKESV